jgi:hypothetical protein
MNEEAIGGAREHVRNLLGEAMAAKATDEFCLALARPQMASRSVLESVAGPAQVPSAIVEFAPRQETVGETPGLVEELRRSRAWGSLRRRLRRAHASERTMASQVPQLLRQVGSRTSTIEVPFTPW